MLQVILEAKAEPFSQMKSIKILVELHWKNVKSIMLLLVEFMVQWFILLFQILNIIRSFMIQ